MEKHAFLIVINIHEMNYFLFVISQTKKKVAKKFLRRRRRRKRWLLSGNCRFPKPNSCGDNSEKNREGDWVDIFRLFFDDDANDDGDDDDENMFCSCLSSADQVCSRIRQKGVKIYRVFCVLVGVCFFFFFGGLLLFCYQLEFHGQMGINWLVI